MWEPEINVNTLLGKTVSSITGGEVGSDDMTFNCTDGTKFHLYHYQDCCESVSLEDVCGDLEDLVGSPITMAEEVEGEAPERTEEEKRWIDSETWTFYKFATEKGYVTLRWLGSSNGYYSESVSFSEIKPKN